MAIKSAPASQLDPATFKKQMLAARKLFASKGIKSKADAYQLINQGFSEKRFNEADVRALQHAASLVFDEDSFTLAKTLMNAKDKGLKLAADKRGASAPQAAPEQEEPQEAPEQEAPEQEEPQEAPEQEAPQEMAQEAPQEAPPEQMMQQAEAQ